MRTPRCVLEAATRSNYGTLIGIPQATTAETNDSIESHELAQRAPRTIHSLRADGVHHASASMPDSSALAPKRSRATAVAKSSGASWGGL